MSDEAREREINACAARINAAPTSAEKRMWWTRMVELINGRSAEQVANLEAQKGLVRQIARRAA